MRELLFYHFHCHCLYSFHSQALPPNDPSHQHLSSVWSPQAASLDLQPGGDAPPDLRLDPQRGHPHRRPDCVQSPLLRTRRLGFAVSMRPHRSDRPQRHRKPVLPGLRR